MKRGSTASGRGKSTGVRRFVLPTLVAVAASLFLSSLSLVTWRQARAREVLTTLDSIRFERSLVETDRAELITRIQTLESRAHVQSVAEDRLGMHVPGADEMVTLSGVGR